MIKDYYKATVHEIWGGALKAGVIGVELELEGENLPLQVNGPHWKVVEDGSLRGGLEYVSKSPETLESLAKAIDELHARFKEVGSRIRDAYRGSVHMHVNYQNKTVEQIFTSLYLWLLVEPLWMRLCGPTRFGNLFCLPSHRAGDLTVYAEALLRVLRNLNFFELHQRGKYASLNTDCITTFGSLEFRTFPSTSDKNTILKWANWCLNLTSKGCDIQIKDMSKVWQFLQNDPRQFYSQIFDKESLKDYQDFELAEFAEAGIEAASPLLIVGQQHLIEKKKLLARAQLAAYETLKTPEPNLFEILNIDEAA